MCNLRESKKHFLRSEAVLQKLMCFFTYPWEQDSCDSWHTFPQEIDLAQMESYRTGQWLLDRQWSLSSNREWLPCLTQYEHHLCHYICARYTWFGTQIANMKPAEMSPVNLWTYAYGIRWKHFRIKTREVWGSSSKKYGCEYLTHSDMFSSPGDQCSPWKLLIFIPLRKRARKLSRKVGW